MPLDASGLQSDLAAFFADPPLVMAGESADLAASRAACAQQWSGALQTYAAGIVPASTTVAAAASTLSGALASAFALASAAPAFDAALLSFATAIGGGMAGFAAVPPPAPLNVAALLSSNAASHADAAANFASLIDAWMRTGIANPLPTGAPVPWG